MTFFVVLPARAGSLEESLISLTPGSRFATSTLSAYAFKTATQSNFPGEGLLPEDRFAFLVAHTLALDRLTVPCEEQVILGFHRQCSASKVPSASATPFHSSFPLKVEPLLQALVLVAALEVFASLLLNRVLRARPINEHVFVFLVNRQFAVAYFLP